MLMRFSAATHCIARTICDGLAGLSAATTSHGWRPGIGDPTVAGWFTVFAYSVAALVSLGVARRAGRAFQSRFSLFWWGVTGLMLFLCVNKQLDLQTLFTMTGKRMAVDGGWHDSRHEVQIAFIVGIAAFSVIALPWLAWLLRAGLARHLPVLLGLAFQCVFVVARATSFYRVDELLRVRTGCLVLNSVLELGGIALVGFGAWFAGRSPQFQSSERPR